MDGKWNDGRNATGTGHISNITDPAGNPVALDLKSVPGIAMINLSGVPWYPYEYQRAKNAAFTGTLMVWPVQAWADGLVTILDDLADLSNPPAQAFYRMIFP